MLVLAVPLLMLGAVTELGLLCAVIAATANVLSRRASARQRATSLPVKIGGAALWAAAGFACLQLVPMPLGLLRALNPRSAALWQGAVQEIGVRRTWFPLTVDPPGTLFAAATAIAVALVFTAVAADSQRSHGRSESARAIATVVALFALVCLAHPIFGLDRPYGVYSPQTAYGSIAAGHGVTWAHLALVTPLVNVNHAAAVTAVAPPLLFALALERRTVAEKAIALIAAVVTATVTVLTMSRGGTAVLFTELVLMGGYFLFRRSGSTPRILLVGAVVLVFAATAAIAAYIALDRIVFEAKSVTLSKLQVARQAWAMAADVPLTGVGRGAFGAAFAPYEGTLDPLARFSHSENWPTQLAAEMGIPAALVFCGLLAGAVALALPSAMRKPVSFAALVALAGLVVHDLADFSMEFAGVGFLAAGLLAVVLSSNSSPSESPTPTKRFELRRIGHGVAGLVATTLLVGAWGHNLDDETLRIAKRWQEGRLADCAPEIHASIARHPAEPYFPMVEGVRLLKSPEAGVHFFRSVSLGPTRPQGHFWLARWFVYVGRASQAYAEYSEALRLHDSFATVVMTDLLAFHVPPDDVIAIMDVRAFSLELAAVELNKAGRHDDADVVDQAALELFPPATSARLRSAARLKNAGDEANARAELLQIIRLDPAAAPAYIMLAELDRVDPMVAEQDLERGLARAPGDLQLIEALVRRRGARLGLDAIPTELERLRGALLERGPYIYRYYEILAEVCVARKEAGQAVKYYLDAANVMANPEADLVHAAELAEQSHEMGLAESLWQRLATLHPERAEYGAAAARVHQATAFGAPLQLDP